MSRNQYEVIIGNGAPRGDGNEQKEASVWISQKRHLSEIRASSSALTLVMNFIWRQALSTKYI